MQKQRYLKLKTRNLLILTTAGFRGSKLFQKQKHKIQFEKVVSYFLQPELISFMCSGKFLLYSDRLLTTLENSVMQFKEPRRLWKAQAQLRFYHLLVVSPRARRFIAIWICFHIWKMAIIGPPHRRIVSRDDVSCKPTLGDPMDCSLPGSSVDGILQARILEWIAISFSIIMYYTNVNYCR